MSRLVEPVHALHYHAAFPTRISRTHIRRMTSRREFVEQATLSALGMMMPISDVSSTARELSVPQPRNGFLDLIRMPDRVIVQTTTGNQSLDHHAGESWTYDGTHTNTYGVHTGTNAFCFWQIDRHGISLCADVRSGALGVQLGERTLDVCDIVCRAGREGESAFAAVHSFCRQMCPNPRLPSQPVYGSNDWYWAYGKNSADSVRVDARHIVELSPAGKNRPFVVIDDGWQPGRGKDEAGVGTWDRGNEKFPDLPGLTADIRNI